MEPQEFTFRKKFRRSCTNEIVTKDHVRYDLPIHQNQELQATVREHQVRARTAVNEAVHESFERCPGQWSKIFQAVQNRDEGQKKQE